MPKFTDRQLDVLALLKAKPSLTYKEISNELGISTSAVGKHFAHIKLKLGANSRQSMLDKFYEQTNLVGMTGVEIESCDELHLPDGISNKEEYPTERPSSVLHFSDSISVLAEVPWEMDSEPQVVPRALDGEYASLIRIAAIAIIVVGILGASSLILAIGGEITSQAEQSEASPL